MSALPHDLDLPDWGPYSKVYAGCSRIADRERGLRWDVSVFPAFYRGRIDVPAVNWESGYAPAWAAPDLSAWAFRHALLGDAVTVETVYAALPGRPGWMACGITCRNRSPDHQTLSLHLVCGLRCPSPDPCGHADPPVLVPARLRLPANAAWCDARDHVERHPAGGLMADGRRWGEFRASGCVDGGGLRLEGAGQRTAYRLAAAPGQELAVRLRATADAVLRLGGEEHRLVAGGWRWLRTPMPERCAVELVAGGPLEVDVLAAVPAGVEPVVEDAAWDPVPVAEAGAGRLRLRYPDLADDCLLAWQGGGRVRSWACGRLDTAMRFATHDHVSAAFRGDGAGCWHDAVIEPLSLAPGEERTELALLAFGREPAGELEEAWRAAPAALAAGAARAWRPAGGAAPGQDLMAATLLTNAVFPTYTRRRYVRHIGPGKAWDSLYFWDSGFTGIGLAEVSPGLAADILHQYLTPEGDPDAAFLHHGTPLPVMVHLAQVLWNRGAARERLAAAYPGLRQLHRFLAGRLPGSGTDRFASRLLSTWHLFYNSGGWDDYPAQLHVHRAGLAERTAPAVTSSHVAASARLLRRLALLTGHDADAGEYGEDIARLGAALRTHAWDDEAGWFGYVLHDAEGRPQGLLRDAAGANLNQGLDGCAPLLAGVCDAGQERRLLAHLADPRELWTPLGLTTVSQASAAFRADGYWNGTVWMPHQWFLWRACLDLGQADLAWRIASTALALWEGEVARSGRSWEHFPLAGGRGAGWHHFGALSAPVLAWHAALHQPGRITGGANLWILAQPRGDGGGVAADLLLDGAPGRTATVLVCLDPGPAVATATWVGAPLTLRSRAPGLWEADLPADGRGRLVVQGAGTK